MDTDLAFCLGRFIDDQVQLIDDRLEKIKEDERIKCRQIEQEKLLFDQQKPIPKSKGSHDEDQALVNRFIQEFRDGTSEANTKRTILDDQTCIDTLRAEFSTKVNACTTYITRLHNLAKPLPNTTNFVQTCKEATDYFRRSDEFDKNFKGLCTVLEDSDATNVVQNTQKFWKEKYGSTIASINTRNQKINAAVTENNFAILSPTSRVLDNAKKLIAARKIISIPSPKPDIIRKFVQQLLLIDEEKRSTINADELFEQLNNSDNEQIIGYAEEWLQQRDAVRNKKEEKDPFETKFEEAKADFGRRRIAQEAKKLALAALLCRLAVGSTNGEQFDQQLKKTVNKQKNSNDESLPVISGDIKEPETEELPVIIQLESDSTDMDQWVDNIDQIRERFASALCLAFHIPDKKIRVDAVDRDKYLVYLFVQPPYGNIVINGLNGTALDAAARMQAVRKCCSDLKANVQSITLGEFGLKIEDKLMDPRWNKTYVWSTSDSDEGIYWAEPIDQGGKSYYCPSGWKRFGVKVAADEKEFDAQWGTWYVAYHGTRGENASNILTSGLRVSTKGCFYDDGVPRVYVSPSIEYCAHPRYAFPWKQTKRNGETCWYQLVFQCRVNPASIDKVGPETLIPAEHKQTTKIDKNFDNGELEWIILGQTGEEFIKNNIICYGLMMRISPVDPGTLPATTWWKQSFYSDSYKES